MSTKQHDVEVILKLYELRRDEVMRRARNWYFSEFNPESAKDIVKLMLSSAEQSAYYRMITSYWEMASSFVNNDGIDERMFLEANTEHVGVFARIEPFIADVREAFGEREPYDQVHRLAVRREVGARPASVDEVVARHEQAAGAEPGHFAANHHCQACQAVCPPSAHRLEGTHQPGEDIASALHFNPRLDDVADLGDARRLARVDNLEVHTRDRRIGHRRLHVRGRDGQPPAGEPRGIAQHDLVDRKVG